MKVYSGDKMKHFYNNRPSRAKSIEEKVDSSRKQGSQLPSILTPTFGDWKVTEIQNGRHEFDVAHPKISKKNPLYDKFSLNEIQKRTPNHPSQESPLYEGTQPLSQGKPSISPLRDLRSEGQVQRILQDQFKENYLIPGNSSTKRRYNSTGKTNRLMQVEEQTTTTKSSLSTNCQKVEENNSSVDKMHMNQNSDEEQLQNKQVSLYQNPNLNKFLRKPKNSFNSMISPNNQFSPLSIKSAGNNIFNLQSNMQAQSNRKKNHNNRINLSEQYAIKPQMIYDNGSQVISNMVLLDFQSKVTDQMIEIEYLNQAISQLDVENPKKAEEFVSPYTNKLLTQFYKVCSLLDKQKEFYEAQLKNNCLFYKYSKINKKQLHASKVKVKQTYENTLVQ